MLSYITIPTGSSTDLFAAAGQITTDLWVLLAIALGVPLAFYVIRRVIALMPTGR